MNNWNHKDEAVRHTSAIEASPELQEAVDNSIRNSLIVDPAQLKMPKKQVKILVEDIDCISGLIKSPAEMTALLDFASYKEPGGKFIEGAMAQEEAICHRSTLYNVLKDKKFMEGFYKPNASRLNRALYNDNMIIARDIMFFSKDQDPSLETLKRVRYADVIVAAAPNIGAAKRYGFISAAKDIQAVISQRVNAVMDTAAYFGYKHLILGAFGCGVFGCDPEMVAAAFHDWIEANGTSSIEYILFAIPGGPNYEAFKKVFTN